jgi:hypothetical protein
MAGVITPAQYVGGGGGGAVSSVFGRSGVVIAATGDYTVAQVTGAAPLASPALTGVPTAPTAGALTNSTQIGTTAYTDSAVGVEKTRALAAEALLAPLASPALTGTPTIGGVPIPQLQAATAVAGYTLVNGTGNIITWTAPNDGNQHRVLIVSSKGVTSTETGGIINCAWTTPNAESQTTQVYPGAQAAGAHFATSPLLVCIGPNTTVTISQGSALTGGASVLFAEIWGS